MARNKEELPQSVVISNEEFDTKDLANEVAYWIDDYLADKYGYCVGGYGWSIEIKVDSITWDTKED